MIDQEIFALLNLPSGDDPATTASQTADTLEERDPRPAPRSRSHRAK
jgi:hypothetical protein